MSPSTNPYSEPPACASCGDQRFVYRADYSAKACPVCGCSCGVPTKGERRAGTCLGCTKRRDLMHALYARREPPQIRESDLTSEERRLVAEWRARHPETSTLTMLRWVEGSRYHPGKDAAFLKELFSLGITVETERETT
jgi:hypothetical protein